MVVASSERGSAEFRCRPAPPPPPPCSSERRRRRGGGTAHVLHVRPERQTRHWECRWHQTMPRCTGQGTWQNVLPRLYTPTYNTRLQRSPLFPHSLSLSPCSSHNYTEEENRLSSPQSSASLQGRQLQTTHSTARARHNAAPGCCCRCCCWMRQALVFISACTNQW